MFNKVFIVCGFIALLMSIIFLVLGFINQSIFFIMSGCVFIYITFVFVLCGYHSLQYEKNDNIDNII